MGMDGFKREKDDKCPKCCGSGQLARWEGDNLVYSPCYACCGSGIVPTANPETPADPEFIYRDALDLWGFDAQVKMAIEEMAELIVKLVKFNRNTNGSTMDEICEEIADVEIMMEQCRLIFGVLATDKAKREKLLRLGLMIAKSKTESL